MGTAGRQPLRTMQSGQDAQSVTKHGPLTMFECTEPPENHGLHATLVQGPVRRPVSRRETLERKVFEVTPPNGFEFERLSVIKKV